MEWHGESSYRHGREPKMISKLATAITLLGEKLWMGCDRLRHDKLRRGVRKNLKNLGKFTQ